MKTRIYDFLEMTSECYLCTGRRGLGCWDVVMKRMVHWFCFKQHEDQGANS